MKDDSPFVLAGLWEGWKDPATDQWLRTCTIITGEPNDLVAQIHTRMPVILPEEDHAKWLGETEDGEMADPGGHFLSRGVTPSVAAIKAGDHLAPFNRLQTKEIRATLCLHRASS